jgi:hypothetical protein
MAVRIQLRRDTANNWFTNNPVLRPGEIGIETDTLKFKIGPAVNAPAIGTAWNSITAYANVTPTGLSSSLGSYILASTQGAPSGPAELDSNGDLIVPENSVILWNDDAYSYTTTLTATQPTADRTITFKNADGTVAFTSDIPSTTDSLSEGSTNKYFTDERAQDATASALAAGSHTNITVTYNDNANSISLAAAPGYVDEQAVDAVAAALAAGTHTNISVSYNDNDNAISLTGAVTYTDENAQDAVGNAVGNGLDYDDSTGAISVDPSEFALSAVGAPTANVSMASYKITNLASPEASADAATKSYVDNIASGLNFHPAVHFATSTNITTDYNNGTDGLGATLTAMSNGPIGTIDGHQAVLNDRVLVKAQTDATQNGIYYVSNVGGASSKWVLTRALDADNSPSGEIAYGDFCFVQNGTLAGGYGYIVTTTGTITIGTTNINYTQFNAGQSVVAGNGLSEPSVGTLAIDTSITADLSTAQTFTNKTLTSPKINENVALTSTATELNILDGATLSTTELNYVDGVTSSIQTQLNDKAPIASPTFTGTVSGITSSMVGLGNVDNTSDANKPVSTATQTALDLKVDESLFDAKGDLLVGSADNTPAKLSVGTNGYLLTANSSATNGVEWAAAPISLPSQTGNDGKYLTTDGSSASWATLVVPITTGTATVTANTATTVDTTALSAFTSIEYMVSLKQGSKIRTSKVILQDDGTSVDMTEFAITETGGTMSGVVVSAAVSSTNAVLQVTVTDAATTNVTVKFSKVAL